MGIFEDRNKLWMRKPKRSVTWTTFIDVFATDFWATFIAMLFGLTLSFYLLSKFGKREKTFRLGTSLATVFSSFLALGIPIDLNRK